MASSQVDEQTEVFTREANHDNLLSVSTDRITVSRDVLEKEHGWLIARVHELRKLLGYPPLQTGQEIRRQHSK